MQLCLSLSFSVIPWKTGKSMTARWRGELLRSEQSPLQAHVHSGLCSGWGEAPCLASSACCSSSWHKHHHSLMGLAPGPQTGGRIQHLLPVAKVSSNLLLPLRPAPWHRCTCPSTPLCATRLWDLASSHHGLLCGLLELDEAYLPHLAAVAVGGAAQSR